MLQAADHLWEAVSTEIGAMTPSWVRTLLFAHPVARPLHFSETAKGISKGTSGVAAPVALLRSDIPSVTSSIRIAVDPVLPQGWFFKREIRVPAGAVGSISKIAALDLVRATPFKADEVVWSLEPARREGQDVVATQWVARRSDLLQLEKRLAGLGMRTRVFRVEGRPELAPLPSSLGVAGRHVRKWQLVNAVLFLCLLFLGAWIWLGSTLQLARQLDGAEAEIARLQQSALTLRLDIDARRESDTARSAFIEVVIQRQRLVDALRDITVALPDDTWVSDLAFRPDGMTITGQTASSAAALILGLSSHTSLRNPRLSGQVSRVPDGDEVFELSVDFGRAG